MSLILRKLNFAADWRAVGRRCVVDPECCLPPFRTCPDGGTIQLSSVMYATLSGFDQFSLPNYPADGSYPFDFTGVTPGYLVISNPPPLCEFYEYVSRDDFLFYNGVSGVYETGKSFFYLAGPCCYPGAFPGLCANQQKLINFDFSQWPGESGFRVVFWRLLPETVNAPMNLVAATTYNPPTYDPLGGGLTPNYSLAPPYYGQCRPGIFGSNEPLIELTD